MRYSAWPAGFAGLLLLAACGGVSTPEGTTRLTLRDPLWERVNVQIVITKSADCDNRGPGYMSSDQFVMQRDADHNIDVPDGAALCWRRDRDPKHPVAGDWSGWSRAQLNAGYPTKTDL